MRHSEPIVNIMTRDVHSVQVGQKLSEVRRLLAERAIHHVPVLDGRRLVGLISATDMMRLTFESYNHEGRTSDALLDTQFLIADVMQTRVVTLDIRDTIRDAAEKLKDGRFHSLPVVEGDELVGIVTSTDLIRYLLELF